MVSGGLALCLDHVAVDDEAHDLSNTLCLMSGDVKVHDERVLRLPLMRESHLPFCVASFLSCVLVQLILGSYTFLGLWLRG